MNALHIARQRWHLAAPRQVVDCGCLWVIPRTGGRYRSFWCRAHRASVPPKRRQSVR